MMINNGQIIKIIRTTENLGQEELADKLNVTRTYLSQIENGKKQPSLTFLKQFSQMFSIPLPLLFCEHSQNEENKEIYEELRNILGKLLLARNQRTT